MPRYLNIPEWGLQIVEKRNKLYIMIAITPPENPGEDDDIKVGAIVAENEDEALSFIPDEERKGIIQYIVFDLISIVGQARTLEIASNVISKY
jgi:hypothetical protein